MLVGRGAPNANHDEQGRCVRLVCSVIQFEHGFARNSGRNDPSGTFSICLISWFYERCFYVVPKKINKDKLSRCDAHMFTNGGG